ncbi:hypothetical protein [Rhodoferax sp. BLA1]|uniref:hypothetical protein n=1 Tax=Rhodoferax sp. BLA1 TaxID=2576062 RepID=UPI0015D3F328|nr:hypothetical protein [Rhodoferax sp. BLA1]
MSVTADAEDGNCHKATMKIAHILMLMLFAVGMGLGQLLLKFSAKRQSTTIDGSLLFRLTSLLSDWPFLLGATLYGLLLVYWIWLLTFLPLSRAYPFTFLSLVVAAIGGFLFFQEPLTFRFVAGMAIIGVGLVVLSTG